MAMCIVKLHWAVPGHGKMGNSKVHNENNSNTAAHYEILVRVFRANVLLAGKGWGGFVGSGGEMTVQM